MRRRRHDPVDESPVTGPDGTTASSDPADSAGGHRVKTRTSKAGGRLAGTDPPPVGGLISPTGLSLGGLGFVPVVVQGCSALDAAIDDGTVPRAVRLTLLTRRHARAHEDDEVLACSAGERDTLFGMEDGYDQVVVARVVGTGGGATYCLAGRTHAMTFGLVRSGEEPAITAFDDGRNIALCAVADDATNIVVVDTYRTVSQVPPALLPGSPPVIFDRAP